MKFINKKALKFALHMLPVGIIGGILTVMLLFSSYGEEMTRQLLRQMPKSVYFLITVFQVAIIYTGILGYLGYILADKVNLIRKLSIEKKSILIALAIGVLGGFIFLLDYLTFGRVIPQVAASYTKEEFSMLNLLTSVIYGGIVEEIMLRLFFMSLIAFILWKIFDRKEKESISGWVFVTANIVAAVAFAAGHLPATVQFFGELNALILIRNFLFNGGLGILFGWLYKKYGLQYAIAAHAITHIVKHAIFLIIL